MTPKNLPWPKKGDRAFVDGDMNESLHLASINKLFHPHAEAFKLSVEMVIDAYQNRPRLGHCDELFFPICYLYRHCIELKLKELIRLGLAMRFYGPGDVTKLKGRPKTETEKGRHGVLQGHNLANLWNFTHKFLRAKFRDEDQTPERATEAVILELHQADPNGQVFRYERDNDGKRHEHETVSEFVDLDNLRRTMDNVCSFLDCCQSMLIDELSGWDGP